MSIIDECIQFLEDLILGDFNGEQMVSAQVIGGLISLIPVMDQVMDARDISGCLYRVNKRGGFSKATLDDKVDLGFAAFGVVPAVGSAFRTVFKPLYKQRKTAKGIVNNGVAMVERMLGHRKGGAVRWVKAMDWAGNTQAAIVQADLALESCISLLEYLAQAHWWCPDRLELLARDVAPSLRSMRGKLAEPIREAAAAIREFLEGLLGEHAAAVAMSIAMGAAPSTRSARFGRQDRTVARSTHSKVADKPRTQGRTTTSGVANSVQNIAYSLYTPLNFALKGLLGEHIAEHYVIEHKGWGLQWNRHDIMGGNADQPAGWQTQPRKLNDNQIPLYLCSPTAVVLQSGIDSAWLTNRSRPYEFSIVEAKASMNANPALANLLNEALNQPSENATGGRGRRNAKIRNKNTGSTEVLSNSGSNKVMQMSRAWIDFRIGRDLLMWQSRMRRNYSRHVVLVTPLQAADHIRAAEKIIESGFVSNPVMAQQFAEDHSVHHIQKEYGEAELDQAEAQYAVSGKPPVKKKTNSRGK
jgi:hypothetical protein